MGYDPWSVVSHLTPNHPLQPKTCWDGIPASRCFCLCYLIWTFEHLSVRSSGWCCCFCSEDSLSLQHPTCSAVYKPTLCPFLTLLSLWGDVSVDRQNLRSFRMSLFSFVVLVFLSSHVGISQHLFLKGTQSRNCWKQWLENSLKFRYLQFT